ncbi:MAG: YidC/Oxa1 family membrane protein insertase [Patescibacteria group bacterium]
MEWFNTLLYEPLFNTLMFLVEHFPGNDLGLAIIALTLLIKVILFSPSLSAIKSQRALQEMQPKLNELKEKYKDNREELSRQLLTFYKEHKVNPLSSCLPLLIQLPILIALYQVFINGLKTDPDTGFLVAEQFQHLYSSLREIYTQKVVNTQFLGILDISKSGNWPLAILSGILQYLQTRRMLARQPQKVGADKNAPEDQAAAIGRQMTTFMPLLTVWFGATLPAGITLYWIVNILFTVIQQEIFLKIHPVPKPALLEEKKV